MEKNVAGKWIVFAYGLPNHATLAGMPVTGDAANITANVRIDGAAANATDDVNPTELEDGYYVFDITAAESNGDNILLTPQSSTANVQVIAVPGAVWTRPPNFNDLGIETDGDLTKVNTLNAHVAQTGDSFARLGTPAGASVSADMADVPTVAEMNARTLVANAYFDPAADAVANVTLVATTTNLTTKTGFSLSTAGILAIWHQALTAIATAGSIGKLLKDEVTSVRMATLTDWINGGRLDNLLDAIPTTPMRGTDGVDTAPMRGTNGVDTATMRGTDGVDTAAMRGTNSAATEAKQDIMQTAINGVPTNSEFNARTPTAAQLAYIVANAATGIPIVFSTAGGSTTAAVLNTVDGSASSAVNDQYNGRLIVFTSGSLKGVVTDITDYDGTTKVATITAIPTAPTAAHAARLI